MTEPDTRAAEQEVVLACLQQPGRLADLALTADHFQPNGLMRELFRFATNYRARSSTKTPLDLGLAASLLAGEKYVRFHAVLDEFRASQPVSEGQFRHACSVLARAREQAVLQDGSAQALERVMQGDVEGGRQVMRASLAAGEAARAPESLPENVRTRESRERALQIVQAKVEAHQAGARPDFFTTGFRFLDARVTSQRGQMTVVGGYTGDGKTQVGKSIALANALQGRRVLYVSLEMSVPEIRTLMAAQLAHRLDPHGLDYRRLHDGTATEPDRALYDRALRVFSGEEPFPGAGPDDVRTSSVPACLVWAPDETTLERLQGRVEQEAAAGLDVLVVDYLELIRSDGSGWRGDYRHWVTNLAVSMKALARRHNIWVVALHQISRGGRDAAEKRDPHHYTLRDLGESGGVEKNADTVIWIYSDDDLKRQREARVGIAKARQGDTLVEGLACFADFRLAALGDLATEADGSAIRGR